MAAGSKGTRRTARLGYVSLWRVEGWVQDRGAGTHHHHTGTTRNVMTCVSCCLSVSDPCACACVCVPVSACVCLCACCVPAGSVLTQKIATDNLADAFMAFNTNYHDTGLFGVYAVTDRDRSPDLSWVIMNEVGVCGWVWGGGGLAAYCGCGCCEHVVTRRVQTVLLCVGGLTHTHIIATATAQRK